MATQYDVRRITLSRPGAEPVPGRFAFGVQRKGKLKAFVRVWMERAWDCGRFTADTNVIVSPLVFGGKPLTILQMAQAGEIELAISEPIINETLRIVRDKFYRSREQTTEMESYLRAITRTSLWRKY